MNGTFADQLGGVAGVFEQWGACERTVVACALARKVPWPGLKLLQRAVDAALSQHCEDERLERDANDENFLAALMAINDEEEDEVSLRLEQLLALLPLLRPSQTACASLYARGAATLAARAAGTDAEATHRARLLLALLLVHPALPADAAGTLTQWLRYLESHIAGKRTDTIWHQRLDSSLLGNNIWSSNSTFRKTIGKNVEFRGLDSIEDNYDFLQESFSKNGKDVELSMEGEKNFDVTISQPKSQRSNSLTPPSSNFMQMSSSAENLTDEQFVQKPRSFSLSSEHSLSQIRPLSVIYGTTGSETRLDDLRCNNFAEPGMCMVGPWLKSLRLHKYVWLFSNVTYDQMMAMDEEYLEKLGVTKGARHKLLLSIARLTERETLLTTLVRELARGADVARVLTRLAPALLAPFPARSTLPAGVVRVLGAASKRLEMSNGHTTTDDDSDDVVDPMSLHCWLVERALHHWTFAEEPLASELRRLRHRLPPAQFFSYVASPLRRPRHRWRGGGAPRPRPAPRAAPPPPSVTTPVTHVTTPVTHVTTPVTHVTTHVTTPVTHVTTPAAPLVTPAPPPEYAGLDALCLQMTETAIDGDD